MVTLRLAAEPAKELRDKIVIYVRVMSRMVGQACGINHVPQALEIFYGDSESGAGLLYIQLPDHFPEEKGPIELTVGSCLERIADALALEKNTITVQIDYGPEGTPAPPGRCAKDLDPQEPDYRVYGNPFQG